MSLTTKTGALRLDVLCTCHKKRVRTKTKAASLPGWQWVGKVAGHGVVADAPPTLTSYFVERAGALGFSAADFSHSMTCSRIGAKAAEEEAAAEA